MAVEEKNLDTSPEHPGKILGEMLQERGWTQDDLAKITGYSRQTINELVAGKNGITKPEMAIALASAFGNSALDWMKWDAAYRLSLIGAAQAKIVMNAAHLYEIAPVRDMQKRGWISETKDAATLERELENFYGVDSLGAISESQISFRRGSTLPNLTPQEKAWCRRARQIARTMLAEQFDLGRIEKARGTLRRLAVHPKESCFLGKVLADYGIRFLVIEPLPGVKIDGAALWDEVGPIIAVSIRHDRVDGFWFTVMHEFEHIKNQDPISVDSAMVDAVHGVTVALINDEVEDRANIGAANSLVPTAEMDSFIRRVGPLYNRERIMQFANRMRIHPWIIVGQLQHKGELGYSALRNQLVKIREHVISTALTDGWGHSIAPLSLERGTK
jgi:HTH-type transcriptional regulator/antitoxin HigA